MIIKREPKAQPKENVVLLNGKAYHEFRKSVAHRDLYHCQYCGRYTPFDSEYQINGEVSHDPQTRKKGGDVLSNAKWSCMECHAKKHAGNLK